MTCVLHKKRAIPYLCVLQGCYDKMLGWFTTNSTYIVAAGAAVLAVEVRHAGLTTFVNPSQ